MNFPFIKKAMIILAASSLIAFAGCCEKKENEHGGAAEKGHSAAHWTYKGETGPAHWGDLEEKYASCKLGKEQSPIDLKGPFDDQSRSIAFHYKAATSTIIDNGHTVEIDPEKGGRVEINGESFELVQFHFHTPSEHTVDGKSFPMEMHLVHKNAAKQLAVVGILFEEGAENPTIAKLWASMPKEEHEKMDVAGGEIDPTNLLPEKKTFFSYNGSLTTPPCSEDVKWQVMETPMSVSAEQIEMFRSRHPGSNRPVQPLNERKLQK